MIKRKEIIMSVFDYLSNDKIGFDFKFTLCEKNCTVSKRLEKVGKKSDSAELLLLKSITVWIKKPHVVNRRSCGAKLLLVEEIATKEDLVSRVGELIKSLPTQQFAESCLFEELCPTGGLYTLFVRHLIPKSQYFPTVLEIVLYDKSEKAVYFLPINDGDWKNLDPSSFETKEIPYFFQLKQLDDEGLHNNLFMAWSCDHSNPSFPKRQLVSTWLSTILYDKLVNWAAVEAISTTITSLKLVDMERYQQVYMRLKNLYGRDLVKNWTESTDPLKFVYEDIAIASYLLLLWEDDRREKNLTQKQSFVDLGCGNGLLVYLLTKEGHKGLGIDLRKRKIWDTFGPDIDLKESMIKPSSESLFPDHDWIIGNHSDELTPWIPVIAARSSYTCSFFVLPCCHFDFTEKFTKKEKGKSKHGSYLDYVNEVIVNCGFTAEGDTLRIPSTKRFAYVGRHRSYPESDEEKADKERQAFIDKRTGSSVCKQSSEIEPSQDPCVPTPTALSTCAVTKPSEATTAIKQEYKEPVPILSKHPNSHKRNIVDPLAIQAANSDNPLLMNDSLNNTTEQYAPSYKKSKVDVACIEKEIDQPSTLTLWASNFKPRKEVKTRNCQTVAEKTKKLIVDAVFKKVLEDGSTNVAILSDDRKWCKGGSVPLSVVASMFDKSTLMELKCENGGVQTLIKNHANIFNVFGGNVWLRDFTLSNPWIGGGMSKKAASRKLKAALCWFNDNHPDGCPKSDKECWFAHGEHDLVEGAKKKST